MDVTSVISGFAAKYPWIPMAIALYLVFVQAVKGVRDALDTTPLTDDNWLERTASVIVKTGGYLIGIRAK